MVHQRTVLVLVAAILIMGCASVPLHYLDSAPCTSAAGIAWAGPRKTKHRCQLNAWCDSVGPVLVQKVDSISPADVAKSGLTVITWNEHVGNGDLRALLRAFGSDPAVVVLLQEVWRYSKDVPFKAPPGVHPPEQIPSCLHDDIAEIAKEFKMSLVYVPSMLNGEGTHEDRGNAILSSLPISGIMGIELPFKQQRRVAVMATITATMNGKPWQIGVVSLHLDTLQRRKRQAVSIAKFLSNANSAVIIGGDLNSLVGTFDPATRAIDHVIPRIDQCGKAKTFYWDGLGFLFDHLFTTLPKETLRGCFVGPLFKSDHKPVVIHLFRSAGQGYSMKAE